MRAHVERVAPPGVTVSVRPLHGGHPGAPTSTAPSSTPPPRLATAFDREPVIVGEGGSIPVVGDFQRILKVPVLGGFGLPARTRTRRTSGWRWTIIIAGRRRWRRFGTSWRDRLVQRGAYSKTAPALEVIHSVEQDYQVLPFASDRAALLIDSPI
jgi:hypothetical protein